MAAYAAIRSEGLPALQLWEIVLGREINLVLLEDNNATMQVLKSGRTEQTWLGSLKYLGNVTKFTLPT
eukprot:8105993-Heterocapsa_arctica.AAC.1